MTAFTLAHLSDPASAAAARAALARSRGQARARLSQLDPQPPQISPPRRARCAGRRHAGAAAGPHRGDRRSRQSGAGGGIRAGAGLAQRRRHARSRSPSFPAITTPMSAPHGTVSPTASATICAVTPGADGDVSVPAPPRPAGADRRLLGGADPAADGHGHARPRAARALDQSSCAIVGRGRLPGAAGASSPAFEFAHEAADRFEGNCARC